MSRKLIEYTLVVLVAIIFSLLLIWALMSNGGSEECKGCTVTALPLQRQECEKQFSGGIGSPRVLQPGNIDEYLIGFFDPSMGGGGGYGSGSPSGYGTTSGTGATPVAGFVIARARPQTSYDANSGSYTGGQFNPTTVPAGQAWDDVRMAVVSFVSPLRNENVCAERPVKFFEDKFEAYCDLPTRFVQGEAPKQSYRVFMLNNSTTPIEYCLVSNCDESHGRVCQIELQTGTP
jgi:hypothetical protein